MLIDELKMADDSSSSFLNLRKQHANLKLNFYLRLKHKTNSLSKPAPLTPLTKRLYEPTPDTQTRLNCLRNQYLKSPTLRILE